MKDIFTVVWQILGNTDPARDIVFISENTLFIDGTIKAFSQRPFKRKWPNIVCSGEDTIKIVDEKWDSLGTGPLITSPSLKWLKMVHGNGAIVRAGEG